MGGFPLWGSHSLKRYERCATMNRRELLGVLASGAAVAAFSGTALASDRRGKLLHHAPLATSIKGARAWRVTYRSADVNNVEHDVTGMVIAPAKRGSNRPIMTWCHGTTGLGNPACPSAQPDPAREFTTYFSTTSTQQIDYGVPGLQGWIDAGYVVCATDYQGLGSPGVHQYTVNRSNARDAVFIAHAARALDAGAGTKLACVGWSQGGGAAAAVAELPDGDFGELTLVGSVPMSPGVPTIGMASPTGMSAALTDKKVPPDAHMLMVLMGFVSAYPKLRLSDVLTPLGVQVMETVWSRQPVHHINDTVARTFRLKGPILKPEGLTRDDWRQALKNGSAARVKPRCPLLVCVDGFDGGTVIPVVWQNAYVEAMRALGGTVEVREYPNDDHFSLPPSAIGDARKWLTALVH